MARSNTKAAGDALTLDVRELKRRGVLAPGARTRGVIRWTVAGGATIASVSYEADLTRHDAWLRLRFSLPGAGGARKQVDQLVWLEATRPGFGGMRWWFVDEGRRVGELQMLGGETRFGAKRLKAEDAKPDGVNRAAISATRTSAPSGFDNESRLG